jgi:hypothetical protein
MFREEERGREEERKRIPLVTRLCLVTQMLWLCLQFSAPKSETEPLDIGSQAEPGNQLNQLMGSAWERVKTGFLKVLMRNSYDFCAGS